MFNFLLLLGLIYLILKCWMEIGFDSEGEGISALMLITTNTHKRKFFAYYIKAGMVLNL